MGKIRNSALKNVHGDGYQKIYTDDNGTNYRIRNPGVYRFCFPQNGQKKQATEKCRPFRGKIRTAAQVALLRCRILPYGKSQLYY